MFLSLCLCSIGLELVLKNLLVQEMHHLKSVDPDAMEMDEVSSWIDFREVLHNTVIASPII